VLGAQIIERCVTPDIEPFVKDDAARLQPVDAAHDDLFLKLEAGNAIRKEAARAVMPVIDMQVIARDVEIFGGAEPRWSRTDNPDRLAARPPRRQRLDPALFPRGIGDVFFNRADGDGTVARKFDDAIAFAQAILWADAAADFGHGRGAVGQFIGFAQAAFGGQAQPVGDVVVQRAMHRAIGDTALRTARGLFDRRVLRITVGDFSEILGTQIGGALGGIGLSVIHKFQHRVVGHRALQSEGCRTQKSV
jgi:hypothetical protein